MRHNACQSDRSYEKSFSRVIFSQVGANMFFSAQICCFFLDTNMCGSVRELASRRITRVIKGQEEYGDKIKTSPLLTELVVANIRSRLRS